MKKDLFCLSLGKKGDHGTKGIHRVEAQGKDKATPGNTEMSFMGMMKDKTGSGNTGNVLHEFDERQNRVGKYRKCPS